MIQFKAYQESDKGYLWDTYIQAMKPLIELIWGWENNWQQNDFDSKLAKYQTLLLKKANRKIGYVQLENNFEELFINMFIIQPSWQSKGIGKSVLNELMITYPNKKIRLKCFKVNQSAYNFYLREGFVIADSDDDFHVLEKIT